MAYMHQESESKAVNWSYDWITIQLVKYPATWNLEHILTQLINAKKKMMFWIGKSYFKVFNYNHLQNIASNPQFITSRDANRRANLEFPLHKTENIKDQKSKTNLLRRRKKHKLCVLYLAWHHFSIDATDVYARIKTGLIVRIYNITPKCLVCTRTAVVWTLIQVHIIKMS